MEYYFFLLLLHNKNKIMTAEEEYLKSLEIVKEYEKKLKISKLKSFRYSEVLKKYFESPSDYEDKLINIIKENINNNIDICDIINIIIDVSYNSYLKNEFKVEESLKSIIKIILNDSAGLKKTPQSSSTYDVNSYEFINNSYLDYYKSLFIYLLKDNKILNSVTTKTIIRVRDYIGSNLSTSEQLKYLHIYVFLIRRINKKILIDMGNKYFDEFTAYKKAFENYQN